MVADLALYSFRLADRFLDNSASLMILTVSDRSEFRLVAEEFEAFSQLLIHFTTETMHYYYRDMWFDVDNMSYEELLALEDQIGYVSTGLSKEEALTSLKYSKYFLFAEEDAQNEFCSICQLLFDTDLSHTQTTGFVQHLVL
ncbi:hypothetical protein TIFTF001_016626 [Ficus carica]|uniref:RING-type E3 ubiquitin transferase n=1 Tax=Ficus carica TaxID=3494 RepID=A0AA88A6K9_FICCA|nr:hypothetical protein TIFTF001_016626 [Ficus carica]